MIVYNDITKHEILCDMQHDFKVAFGGCAYRVWVVDFGSGNVKPIAEYSLEFEHPEVTGDFDTPFGRIAYCASYDDTLEYIYAIVASPF